MKSFIFHMLWYMYIIGIWLLVTGFLSLISYEWIDPLGLFKMWPLEDTRPGQRLGIIGFVFIDLFLATLGASITYDYIKDYIK